MTAKDLAPYQSPKLSAVLVGAAVVNKIKVEGGMPDEFAPPPAQEFPPGTIIVADEPLPLPPPPAPLKAANG